MAKDKHHNIDKLFQDAFQNHEVSPPFNMWNKIETNLPLTETDMMFKKAFEHYEKEPSPEVWDKIKPELPLSLTLRNGLMHLSRIAAVLLVTFTVYIFAQQFDWSNNNGEIAQQQTIEQQETVAKKYYNEKDVLSDEEILDEPLAMLEVDETALLPPGPIEVSSPVPSDSPLNNPENTAKNGEIIPNKVYTKEAILNIDEIAKRVQTGDKERIPSNELYIVNMIEVEEASKIDSTAKEDELKELKNLKMEDVAIASIDLDGKIRRPFKVTEETNSTAALPYLSLQGQPDESFNTKNGVRIQRSKRNGKFQNFIFKCKTFFENLGKQ